MNKLDYVISGNVLIYKGWKARIVIDMNDKKGIVSLHGDQSQEGNSFYAEETFDGKESIQKLALEFQNEIDGTHKTEYKDVPLNLNDENAIAEKILSAMDQVFDPKSPFFIILKDDLRKEENITPFTHAMLNIAPSSAFMNVMKKRYTYLQVNHIANTVVCQYASFENAKKEEKKEC